MRKMKKKKRVEKYITLRAVSDPKELTNHNARHLSLVETGCLSGGLYGRQDLPYTH